MGDDGHSPEQSEIDEQNTEAKPRRRRWSGMTVSPWVREYWVDMGLAVTLLVAFFLLVEPWDIRERLFSLVGLIWNTLAVRAADAGRSLASWGRGLTSSNAIALVILFGVALVTGWRVRGRIVRSERFRDTHCPRCHSSNIYRVRRHLPDRLLGLLGFPAHRYRCDHCGWRGLRISQHAADSWHD